ncbi:GPO family capsid scaffolding protein, partial [Escherichia coli]|nr:GPO family capsid scaffolding protein [Escherichia coli]
PPPPPAPPPPPSHPHPPPPAPTQQPHLKPNPANLFTAAEETVIELEEIQDDKPSLFARVTALFTKKEQSDDARFSDV